MFAAVTEMAAELRHADRVETFRRNVSLHPADDRNDETFRRNVSLHPADDRNDETFQRNVSTPPNDAAQRLADAREAAMRRRIRRAAADGHRRIAAVCGAWHAPALIDALRQPAATDDNLLRDLPAIDVEATWVPWTYGRMTQAGGYGAGVASPGWYGHLWAVGEEGQGSEPPRPLGEGSFSRRVVTTWLTKVGRLLRDEGFDTSPGHLIEAVRLAEALAALRGRPFPALDELNEAAQAVLCGGDAEPMALIRRRLIVGERMGVVPPDAPAVPLQHDLRAEQTRLRLRPEPEPSTLRLDLRQEMHLSLIHI